MLILQSSCRNIDSYLLNVQLQKGMGKTFRNTLDLQEISPQSTIFGFLLADNETFQIKNLIVLLFKIYLYESP